MNRISALKIFSLLTLLMMAFFVFVPAAYAFDGRAANTITIGKDEVINEDLYLSAETIIVDGTINGDLLAAGNSVTINGTVTGDLIAGAREVFINGKIGDDVFSGAAAVTLGPDAEVADDFFAGAAGVETQAGSKIGGTVFVGAFQLLFSGDGAEDLNVGASRMRLEGTIAGDANISVDPENSKGPGPSEFMPDGPNLPNVPAGLTFGSNAKISGKLDYVSTKPLEIPANVVAGSVSHSLPPIEDEVAREIQTENSNPALAWALTLLRRIVGLVVIGLIVAYFAPRWLNNAAEKLQSKPLPSLGVGFISLIAMPFALLTFLVAAILLAVLVGILSLGDLAGLILGFTLLALFAGIMLIILVFGYLAQMVVAYLGGRWLLNKINPELARNIYGPLLLGLVIIALLVSIPYVGNWVGFLVILLGLGALVLRFWQRFQKQPVALETQI